VASNRMGVSNRAASGCPPRSGSLCRGSRHPPAAAANTRGMLLVRGPCVFRGYLRHDGPDPFIELNGRRWYVTGDLVRQDDEGFIYFCDG